MALGSTARALLTATAAAYALYAVFVLVETLDFLALLGQFEGDTSATYDIVDVAFLMTEWVICALFALLFLLLRLHARPGAEAVAACLALTLMRLGLVYFLYLWTDPETRWTPYIYKNANAFSDIVRTAFVPATLLLGLAAAWACWPRKAPPAP